MKTVIKILAIIACIGFIESNAYAFDTDYYVYNGFDGVYSSWSLIATIFANSSYKFLFISTASLGIFLGGAFAYYHLLSGGKAGSLSGWAWSTGIGVTLYLALFVPKGTVIVSDPVLNRYQSVSGIPDGITMTVYILNKIERGLIDIVQISGNPLDYNSSAGGLGFDALIKTTSQIEITDKYIEASTNKYITDCLFYEINRPGTTLKVSDIVSSTGGQLYTQMGLANSNSIVTTYFDINNQNGVAKTCNEAWTLISAWYADPTNLNNMLNVKCAAVGYNTANAAELTQCKSLIASTLTNVVGDPINAETFMQQSSLSAQLANIQGGGGIDAAISSKANTNIVSSGYSMGLMANEYLPLLKAIITAVAVAMLPVIVLFVPTPIGGRMLGVGLGVFVWLAVWGVTDAITHTLATNYAITYFDAIRGTGTGYASIMAIPSAATKSLGLFGMVRFSGMILATIITGALIPIGAQAMSSLSGQFAGQVTGAAVAAGAMALQEGRAGAASQLMGSQATMTNFRKYGFDEGAKAMTLETSKKTAASLSQVSDYGGTAVNAGQMSGNLRGAKQTADEMRTKENMQNLGGRSNFISRSAATGAGDDSGHIRMSEAAANYFGLSQQQMKEFKEGGGLLTDPMAATINNKRGTNFHGGDTLSYKMTGDGVVGNVSASRILRPDDLKQLSPNKDGIFSDSKGRKYSFAGGATLETNEGGYSKISGNIIDHNGQKGHNMHEGHLTLNGSTVTNAKGTGGYDFDYMRSQQTVERNNNLSENRSESLSTNYSKSTSSQGEILSETYTDRKTGAIAYASTKHGKESWSGDKSTTERFQTEKISLGPKDGKYIDALNNSLDGNNSSAKVQAGDLVEITRDNNGNMSNWSISRGGTKTVTDMSTEKTGSLKQVYDGRNEYMRGTEARGSLNNVVQKMFGERAAEVFADAQGATKDTLAFAQLGWRAKGMLNMKPGLEDVAQGPFNKIRWSYPNK